MVNLKVNFGGLSMKNQITTASGTFGYGEEYSQFYDLSRLGGMILKGTSVEPRLGNKGYRIAETPAGMLNSVGLQNPGVHYAVEHYLPWLQQFDVAKIANIVGYEAEDYAQVVSICLLYTSENAHKAGADIAVLEHALKLVADKR